MIKKLCVLSVLLLAAFVAPAMADSATWIGGTTGNAAVDTDFGTAANWAGGVVPTRSYDPDTGVWDHTDIVISAASNTTSAVSNTFLPREGVIYDNYQGTFLIDGGNTGFMIAGANVASGCTLNLHYMAMLDDTAGIPPINLTVAGNLNFYLYSYPSISANLNGGGTVDVGGNHGSWNVTDNTKLTCNLADQDAGYTFDALTGGSTSSLTCAAWMQFSSANFAYTGQIIYTAYTYRPMFFDTSAPAVVGANVQLNGVGAQYSGLSVGSNSMQNGNLTYTACKFSGDGFIDATSDIWGSGATVYTMISNGSTFAPSNTNTLLTSLPGQLTFHGNLQLGQDGAGNNSQIVVAVTGTTGLLGSGYTKFSVNNNGSTGGTITCPDSATNALLDTTLVVNITPGLTPVGINGTNLGTSLLYGQTLNVVHVDGTDLSLTSTFGANIKFVGGFATVTLVGNGAGGSDVQLSNIFSNPTLAGDANNDGQVNGADYAVWAANYGANSATWLQGDFNNDGQVNGADYAIWAANYGTGSGTSATPEPISMIILAIGGGLVALKRRNA